MENPHRNTNGTGGTEFLSATISTKDNMDNVNRNLLVTFEADGNTVNTKTCRVISMKYPKLCFQGDVIAEAMSRFFKKNKIKDIYSYMGD
jgi:hypothetical protein